jgi:hypothetical protein
VVVDALFAAARDGDIEALLAVLGPDVAAADRQLPTDSGVDRQRRRATASASDRRGERPTGRATDGASDRRGERPTGRATDRASDRRGERPTARRGGGREIVWKLFADRCRERTGGAVPGANAATMAD